MKLRGRHLIYLAACGLAGAVAWYALAGGNAEYGGAAAQSAWHYQDGRWVRLSPSDFEALSHERAQRAAGKVQVTGTLRVADGGPLEGAEVVFASGDGEVTSSVSADGSYALELTPSFYRVYARARGYVAVGRVGAARVPTPPSPGNTGTLRSGLAPSLGVFRDLSKIDIEMQRAGIIAGVVRDRAGSPVANAVVRATSYSADNPRPIDGTDVAVTAKDGSFRLVLPEGAHKLDAHHEELAGLAPTALRHVTALRGAPVDADLTMIPGCIIRGVVVDQAGTPVDAGPVEIDNGGAPPNEFEPVAEIRAGGSFRIARTELGTVRLRAWPWESPPTATVSIECGDGTRISDLRLEVAPAAEHEPTITGTLVDEDGKPMQGQYVDLLPADPEGMIQQERAGKNGAFAFYSVPQGRYRISSHVHGHGIVRRSISSPAHALRLQLSGVGSLTGDVRGLEKGSFTLVVDGCRDPDNDNAASIDPVMMPPRSFLVPVDQYAFRIGGLPACSIEARAETAHRSVRLLADLRRGKPTHTKLDLRRPTKKRLLGRVLDGDAPLAGVAIIRLPNSGTKRAATDYAITGKDGRYQLWVYSGDGIHLASQDGREAEIEIDWDADLEERVTTTLSGQ